MRPTLENLKTLIMQLINMEEQAGGLTVKDKYQEAVRLKSKMREHITACKKYNEYIDEIRKEIKEKRRLKNLPEEIEENDAAGTV